MIKIYISQHGIAILAYGLYDLNQDCNEQEKADLYQLCRFEMVILFGKYTFPVNCFVLIKKIAIYICIRIWNLFIQTNIFNKILDIAGKWKMRLKKLL